VTDPYRTPAEPQGEDAPREAPKSPAHLLELKAVEVAARPQIDRAMCGAVVICGVEFWAELLLELGSRVVRTGDAMAMAAAGRRFAVVRDPLVPPREARIYLDGRWRMVELET